jgi:type IV secretory pathway VirB2 component (pilin)
MVALLVGGVIAAPIAAWLVSRLDHRVLGALVGGMILFTNADRVLSLVGIEGSAVIVVRVLIVVATILTCAMAIRGQRRSRDEAHSTALDLAT